MITPEERALEGCGGTAVILADGRPWLLRDGGLCNHLDALRDRMDDAARLRSEVDMIDVANVAFDLLTANYELSGAEASTLIVGADHSALAAGVMEALFGPSRPRRTYTAWAASAMLANGIDPTTVPGHLRPHVLAHLEGSGRCLRPPEIHRIGRRGDAKGTDHGPDQADSRAGAGAGAFGSRFPSPATGIQP